MNISYFCNDAKRRGGGPRLNVIMTLIFLKTVWKYPLSVLMHARYFKLESHK